MSDNQKRTEHSVISAIAEIYTMDDLWGKWISCVFILYSNRTGIFHKDSQDELMTNSWISLDDNLLSKIDLLATYVDSKLSNPVSFRIVGLSGNKLEVSFKY